MSKDKWKKFFIVGYTKPKVDSSRAVKNTIVDGYKEYILDNIDKFNDEERLRVLDCLMFVSQY